MNCLHCGTEMTNNQVTTKKDRISYDMCERCGSLWLDAGELDKMAFEVEGSIEFCEQGVDPVPEQRPMNCPRCDDSVLEKVRFLGSDDIFLHRCPRCGGFSLDGGELHLIDDVLAKIMPVSGRGFSDFVNDVHVPYWSSRVKKNSRESDFHVDRLPLGGAELIRGTSDACPACDADLNLFSVSGAEFEACPRCNGIWLVKDELRKLKNKIENGSLRWMNDEIEDMQRTSTVSTRRSCVKCKTTKMVSVVFGKSSIVVDWCPQCQGMWLDRGDFESLSAYLKREAMHLHTQDIERRLVRDAKRVVTGGPGSRVQELRDAEADLHALINATIFEHPALFRFVSQIPRLI
jgi:Zn-finger nucleic acid-binding protein